MKNNDGYMEHVKECWVFAQHLADALVGEDQRIQRMQLTMSIFDKICSPYHYFLGNDENEPPSPQPPTQKQISYAKQLGVSDPEKMSKQQLSEEIDKAVKSGKK